MNKLKISQYLKRLGLIGGVAMSVASAPAQTWTETAYSYNNGSSYHYLLMWTIYNAGPLEFDSFAPRYLSTSGSSTQDPPWRTLFATLVNETYSTYTEHYSATFAAWDMITIFETYQFATGTNSFSRTNPTESASRTINDHIATDTYYTVTPGDGG